MFKAKSVAPPPEPTRALRRQGESRFSSPFPYQKLRSLGLLLACWLLTVSLLEAQAPGAQRSSPRGRDRVVHIDLAYLSLRVPTSKGYGAFLKERYGLQNLDMHGSRLALGYRFRPRWQLELSTESVANEFRYRDLNQNPGSGRVALAQQFLLVRYQTTGPLWLGFGLGGNTLTRELDNTYRDESITTVNVNENTGKRRVEKFAQGWLGEARLRWTFTSGGRLTAGLATGLRYLSSDHSILSRDPRPFLNESGSPESSVFDLSGWSYDLGLSVGFGRQRI